MRGSALILRTKEMRWDSVFRIERMQSSIDRRAHILRPITAVWKLPSLCLYSGNIDLTHAGAFFCTLKCSLPAFPAAEKRKESMNKNKHAAKLVFLAMMTALGVVISPILRVEGMCPMAHFINVTCAVMLGPWYAFVCALAIGIIRMTCMGIPPLALTGAIFGAFLSGMLYRMSRGRLVWAFAGEVIGTGIIGAILSYPVMTFVWGKTGLTWFFYVPSFIAGTLIGGTIAFLFLKHLQKARLLSMFQETLGSRTYDSGEDVVNDALGIAFSGFIGYLAVTVAVHQLVPQGGPVINSLRYIVLAGFLAAALIYWSIKRPKAA